MRCSAGESSTIGFCGYDALVYDVEPSINDSCIQTIYCGVSINVKTLLMLLNSKIVQTTPFPFFTHFRRKNVFACNIIDS